MDLLTLELSDGHVGKYRSLIVLITFVLMKTSKEFRLGCGSVS